MIHSNLLMARAFAKPPRFLRSQRPLLLLSESSIHIFGAGRHNHRSEMRTFIMRTISRFFVGVLLLLKSGVDANYSIPYPDFRYVAYDELEAPTQMLAIFIDNYTYETWDLPGTAEVEKLDFCSIGVEQQEAAISMGLVDGWQWDCYINHFGNYGWLDLQTDDVEGPFSDLGWTQDSWDGNAAYPASEYLYWDELAPEEQEAAKQICYFKEIWDMEKAIPDWPLHTMNPTTSRTVVPSMTPSLRGATNEPTMVPSDVSSMLPSDTPTTYCIV
jgi:hypothetical protein